MKSGVVLELDRQSRRASASDGSPFAYGPVRRRARPDTESLIEAVSRAATTMSDTSGRIALLERNQRDLIDAFKRAQEEATELVRRQQAAQATAALETERAERAEAEVQWLQAREASLVADLERLRSEHDRLADSVLRFLEREDRVPQRPRRSAA